MSRKIIALDHVKDIKDYIDAKYTNVNNNIDNLTANINNEILENKTYLEAEIESAVSNLNNSFESEKQSILDKISELEQLGNNLSEIEEAKLRLNALETNYTDQSNALDSLKQYVTGESENSIFSDGQLYELISTAMYNETIITDDTIISPNTYTANLVALIAKFGKIKADNIESGIISGSTVQSNETYETSIGESIISEPRWRLNNNGSGHFASGNIAWDSDGKVTLGPGVTISYEQVNNLTDALEKLTAGYSDTIKNYLDDWLKSNDDALINKEELDEVTAEIAKKAEESKKEADAAIESLRSELSTQISENAEGLETKLNNAIEKVGQAITDQAASQLAELNAQKAILEQAIKDADEALDEALRNEIQDAIDNIDSRINFINELYQDNYRAIETLRADVQNLKESALTPSNLVELLEAANITDTSVSGDQIKTPSLLAQRIVSLVGVFGKINASKIVGTEIQGYTVCAPRDVKDENGNYVYETDENGKPVYIIAKDENGNEIYENGKPVYESGADGKPIQKIKQKSDDELGWILNSDGSGHIANKNISWDPNGTVELTENVHIKWKQIDEKPEGVSKFKAMAFKRTNEDISSTKPTGGSYDNPKPDDDWEDGIPAGEETLWATTCEFSFGDTTGDWSYPSKMSDTADFEVVYSAEEAYIEPTTLYRDSDGISITGWLNENNTWTDNGDSKSIWMATATCKNGEWNSWKISKIKGEPGETGSTGNGIESTTVSYAVTSTQEKPTSGWVVDIPKDIEPGKYLWTRVKTTYTDSTVSPTYSYSVARMGIDGTFDTSNLATVLGDFNITSNTISAKTFSSTDKSKLVKGTKYYAVKDNGTFDENVHKQKDDNGNPAEPVEAGENTQGPSWQIAWNGNGYLANGAIRWEGGNDNTTAKVNIDGDVIINGIQSASDSNKQDLANIVADKISVKSLSTVWNDNECINIEKNHIHINDNTNSKKIKTYISNETIEQFASSDILNRIGTSISVNNSDYKDFTVSNNQNKSDITVKFGSVTVNKSDKKIPNVIRIFGKLRIALKMHDSGINPDSLNNIPTTNWEIKNGIEGTRLSIIADKTDKSKYLNSGFYKASDYYELEIDEKFELNVVGNENSHTYDFSLNIPAGLITVPNPYNNIEYCLNFIYSEVGNSVGADTFTAICNDGVFVNNDDAQLIVNNDNAVIISGDTRAGKYYGLKVDKDGLYYCDGTRTWTKFSGITEGYALSADIPTAEGISATILANDNFKVNIENAVDKQLNSKNFVTTSELNSKGYALSADIPTVEGISANILSDINFNDSINSSINAKVNYKWANNDFVETADLQAVSNTVTTLTSNVTSLSEDVANLNTNSVLKITGENWLSPVINSDKSAHKSFNIAYTKAGSGLIYSAVPYNKTTFTIYYTHNLSTISIYNGGAIEDGSGLFIGVTTFTDGNGNSTVIEPIDNITDSIIKDQNNTDIQYSRKCGYIGKYTSTTKEFTINVKVTNSDSASSIKPLTIKIMS